MLPSQPSQHCHMTAASLTAERGQLSGWPLSAVAVESKQTNSNKTVPVRNVKAHSG
jgi:hypothetical protein